MSGIFLPILFVAQAEVALSPTATSPATSTATSMLFGLAIIFAIFVLPFLIGNFLSKRWKMPNHGMAIGFALASLIASLVILGTGKFKYGPDIKGGTILVYELDKTVEVATKEDGGQKRRAKASDLITSLSERLNPAGTKEIVIRPYGEDQIEIIVPDVEQLEIAEIKRVVEQAGVLKFIIVANPRHHDDIIRLATAQAANADPAVRLSNEVRNAEGQIVGIWQEVGRDREFKNGVQGFKTPVMGDTLRDGRTGRLIGMPQSNEKLDDDNGFEKWLQKQGIETVDILLALQKRGEPYDRISGDDLAFVAPDIARNGLPQVRFSMRPAGAQRLLSLTVKAGKDPDGYKSRMAIILDDRVLSAPNLDEPIHSNGQISGNFTQKEVDDLVNILRSGSLPAALGKSPISENQIGAVLGADTVQKGYLAAVISVVLVLVTMVVYYRFSGLIACIALLLNILLTLAMIILIQQPITLPGLAGAVLSVGMAVDANVLIFERIREEIAGRATGRMAIRNGFDRAMSTIVDSNLTTLISAVVLYVVGTDQVRGFAVTLIIGIMTSMFTGVYVSRLLFEIAERLKFANLSMGDWVTSIRTSLSTGGNIPVMKYRNVCYFISLSLITIGLVATFIRGREILDIDFNGGTAIVFALDKPVPAEEIRSLASSIFKEDSSGNPIQISVNTVKMAGQSEDTVYRLDSSLTDLEQLTKRFASGFKASNGAKLVTFLVDVSGLEEGQSGLNPSKTKMRYVALQETSAVNSAEVKDSSSFVPAGSAAQDGSAAPDKNAGALSTQLSSFKLNFRPSVGSDVAKINAFTLLEALVKASKDASIPLAAAQMQIQPVPFPEAGWARESNAGFNTWEVKMPVSKAQAKEVAKNLQKQMESQPVWLSINKIGERVAGQMQTRAIVSILVSLVFIMAYIWFRFHKFVFGIAAVVALAHDVMITLGFIAISHWLFRPLGFLMIDDFKVSLTIVAAFLTIIGYSLNDTIVIFDRIREIKGKSQRLTSDMIDRSVTQTLGRTLMTSGTTLISVACLYFFGGEGIHGFAFCLFVGIVVGTYSSIFVASPILLAFASKEQERVVRTTSVPVASSK